VRLAATLLGIPLALLGPQETTAAPGRWRWPVEGTVVAGFRVLANPYARGQHRGVDIAAPVGTRVSAACSGRVRFAGTLPDGTGAVSVACGRLIATYLELRNVAVRAGQRVAGGARLGAVAPSGDPRQPRPHLHLGARTRSNRARYRDPLALLGAPSPPPLVAPPRAGPRRLLPRERRLPPPPAAMLSPRQPDADAVPSAARLPALAWLGLALAAAGIPFGALERVRRRRRRRVAPAAARGSPATPQ
jgi:murein DD-endopeptidase MepM/ murein hydrolase activator NlpD